MEKRESFKSLMENQSEVREKLFQNLQKDPKPRHILASEIGISDVTLRNFLVEERNIKMVPFLKIKNFVEKNSK